MLMTETLAYTPEEVALRLRVSEETVRREIRAKHLSALQVGKQYRIAPSDLIAYLGKRRYEEWFGPREDLRAVIGSGGLEEAEAHELAARAVRAVRADAEPVSADSGGGNSRRDQKPTRSGTSSTKSVTKKTTRSSHA
jgi:excisionase family DNA binding protein